MPNSKLKKLTIDSHDYLLLYDFNVLVDCEDEAKCNLLEALTQQGRNSAVQLRGLLFAFLKPRLPEIKVETVGDLVRADTIVEIMDAIAEAFVLAASEEYVEKWEKAQEEVERKSREEEERQVAKRQQQNEGMAETDEADEAEGDQAEAETAPVPPRQRSYPVKRATREAGLLSPDNHEFVGDNHTKCKGCGLPYGHPCHAMEPKDA